MNRRNFFVAAIAVIGGLLWPKRIEAGPLRKIWLGTAREGRRHWVRVRMSQLRKGDTFLCEHFPEEWSGGHRMKEWVATSDPWQRNGGCGIDAESVQEAA